MAVIVRLPVPPDGATTKRRPGRPRKVIPVVISEDDYLTEIDAARRDHVAQDDLVALPKDAVVEDVIDEVADRIARETAALGFEAAKAERAGKDASMTRSRRIRGLLQLASIVLQGEMDRRERGATCSEHVSWVRELFVGEVRSAAEEVLPPERANEVLRLILARLPE